MLLFLVLACVKIQWRFQRSKAFKYSPRNKKTAMKQTETARLVLCDLVGSDPSKFFSPYVWRTRMALKHKELPFQVKSLTFSQIKPFIEQHKQQNPEIRTNTVPLLLVYDAQDELKTVVHDSWNIASYLEDQYESSPALFPGSRSTMEPMTKFMSNYANQLVGVVAKCCGCVQCTGREQ